MIRPITNYYNSDDVNITGAELRQTKTRPVTFVMIRNLLYEQKATDVHELQKTHAKIRSFSMAYCKL